ncbi:MAG TPA: glycosyltransferase family 39 protein [Anaerolineales bacterium]|nr:glycosyltransferase family 39 protein [Anaerolineales bacterium]
MNRLLLTAALAAIFTLGLAIRLYDLSDPPFDFHTTRQFRAALIARGMFYADWSGATEPQKTIAIEQRAREALIEPPLFEFLVSRLYLLAGRADLRIPRALSTVFWLLGGAAVFGLARDLSSTSGALIALVYFLFLPFGMLASRSFQPDPLMAALIAAAAWSLYRWVRLPGLGAAVLAGSLTGLAILVKVVALLPLGLGALLLILFGPGLKKSLRDPQTWTVAGLAMLPVGAYYLNGLFISGFLRGQESFRFFPAYWSDPAFYIRWIETAAGICGFAALIVGLIGVFLVRDRAGRGLLAGLWLGYLVYSLALPYHTLTHDYYQLLLIPIAAVSLAAPAALVFDELVRGPHVRLAGTAAVLLIAGAVLFKVWDTRVILARTDYRPEAVEWARFEGLLPPDAQVIALARAYGYPLAYYGWVTARTWPTGADLDLRTLAGLDEAEIVSRHFSTLAGADYFIVTQFSEFDRQPDLQAYLSQHAEIHLEGDGFVIYALNP